MARNPPWTRDELILSLDLYFRLGCKQESDSHPDVIALSDLLNNLPIHKSPNQLSTFRNPAGISMKLGNFLAHDPKYPGSGLQRGNRLEKQIWTQFATQPDHLHRVAKAIAASIEEASHTIPIDDGEGFPEGEVLSRIHHSRERNSAAALRRKLEVLQRTGRLECQACGFDFKAFYGDLGEGFAECHHLIPLSDLPGRKNTRLKDLAILCANCHRMIHKTDLMNRVDEFRKQYLSSNSL